MHVLILLTNGQATTIYHLQPLAQAARATIC